MILFEFYGRVGNIRLQDVAASRGWQVSRARQLIQPKGGVIMAEYFDIGHTRALPWQRRPKAAELLAVLRDPARGFNAVVIGEPQRAFYGNQFSLTYPIFEHFGVQLWVPEVGGPIDPGSEAHDLAMTLFGSQSKGERMHVLEPDPATAPVVARIFGLFLDGCGYLAIAERLTADHIPPPSGQDRARNPHRLGVAWSKSAVRVILGNPRYTGYQVWNKQRRDEVLLDIDDVAAGHVSRMRWNPKDQWLYSAEPTHEALVSRETFDQAQARVAARSPTSPRAAQTSPRPYALRGRPTLWAVSAAPAGPVGPRGGLLPLPLPHRGRPQRPPGPSQQRLPARDRPGRKARRLACAAGQPGQHRDDLPQAGRGPRPTQEWHRHGAAGRPAGPGRLPTQAHPSPGGAGGRRRPSRDQPVDRRNYPAATRNPAHTPPAPSRQYQPAAGRPGRGAGAADRTRRPGRRAGPGRPRAASPVL